MATTQPVRDHIFHGMTRSLCPECARVIDAQVLIRDDAVYLRKRCPDHGWHEALVSSDARWYVESAKYNKAGAIPNDFAATTDQGCPYDCGLCPEHQQHTCLALIEITTRCNLSCSTCFADSGPASGSAAGGYDLTVAQVEAILDRLLEMGSQPEILQISGGEPTLHPQLLDVACGRGASAVHLAGHFGCHVTGLDYGTENILAAEAIAAENGVEHLTTFREGDAEGLPFDDGSFDAVISECCFCTFPDKPVAAAEMARVLREPTGRLGLTDMTVCGPLPEEVQSLLAWVACVAGAGSPEEYVATLRAAGFVDIQIEDQRDVLLDMVADVRRKILGIELAAALGKLRLGDGSMELPAVLEVSEAKRLARRAVELSEKGSVGYTMITARKKAR